MSLDLARLVSIHALDYPVRQGLGRIQMADIPREGAGVVLLAHVAACERGIVSRETSEGCSCKVVVSSA